MTTLIVHRQRIGPILGRHPWVFSGALKNIPDGLESGTPVRLVNEEGGFLAQGYFNSYSQIAVRLWSWDENETVDEKFFEKKISDAYALRKQLVASKKTDSYRLVHSENDLLPGLIVDKYGEYLVLQFHTTGIEFWKDAIIKALKKVLEPTGIYERSDVRTRGIEGAEKKAGLLFGKVPERIKISENGYKFWVDVMGGQKTGFFLDQRDKRQALAKYAEDKTVLNCFHIPAVLVCTRSAPGQSMW
jgi:23S rRNA (cytosine1962-C5)-methyltransferase